MNTLNPLAPGEEPFSSSIDYKDFFENGAVGLHIVDASGRILHANFAELRLLGFRPEDYIGHQIEDFYEEKAVIDDIGEAQTGRKH